MANQVGKRYVCKKCGAEFIVTRGGKGTMRCCGQPMEVSLHPQSGWPQVAPPRGAHAQ